MRMKSLVVITLLSAFAFAILIGQAEAQHVSSNAAEVYVGVWLVNVERIDLAASSYRLDFYIWFKFNPSEIDLAKVKEFEIVNGAPTRTPEVVAQEEGRIEYRIRGEFIKTFDFTRYPFEVHTLTIELEHKNLNASRLIFKPDSESAIDETVNVAGWEIGGFEQSVVEHSYGHEAYSRYVFSLRLKRPVLSAFVKSVLPISVITTISLLTFFISPQNFGQRIGLAVSTLMAASAFHLSLLSGIPPIGYLTLADRMMLSVYAIFLYNLSVSVYIMRLVDAKRIEEAQKFNAKALKTLAILIVLLIAIQLVA
ncbi:MAG: hypothetical protein NZ932_05980 [Candidatus Bathyarchaeota archaeon]|nr:hypothetical protein [Candidatus Bathyarchaeota archaeon]MDW8040910.1 hypothetical protein [Nitrososphaerota archaeon]